MFFLQIVYYCVKLVYVGTPEGKEQKNPPRESREKKIQFFISPLTRPQSRDGGQNMFTKISNLFIIGKRDISFFPRDF